MGVRPPYSSQSAGQAVREIRRFGQIIPSPDYLEGQRVLNKALYRLPEEHTSSERIKKILEVMREEREERDD